MTTEISETADLPTPGQEEDQVTLGDKRVETSTFDRYKGEKGRIDRIALVSKTLIRGWSYWYEGGGKKRTFAAPKNAEALAFCKKVLGEPEQRFGVLLFHYLTDDKGELIEPEKLKGKIKTWVWSETRYEELTNMNRQWPLLDGGFDAKQVDLIIRCTESTFQRMGFTPTPTAHWKTKKQWYDAIVGKAEKAKPKLKMALGKQLSDQEIMALLGGGNVSPTKGGDSAGDVDLSDVVDDIT